MKNRPRLLCLVLALLIFLALALSACTKQTANTTKQPSTPSSSSSARNDKYNKFSSDGITLYLPKTYIEHNDNGQTIYGDAYSCVMYVKDSFETYPHLADWTLEMYGNELLASRELEKELQYNDGLYSFTYDIDINESVKYTYFAVIFKSNTGFYIVEFCCDSREAEEHLSDFIEWAKLIEFYD